MKKMIFVSATSILFSIVVAAQTPTPPPRAATPGSTSSASDSDGGTGAEGKVAYLNAAKLNQGILELYAPLKRATNAAASP